MPISVVEIVNLIEEAFEPNYIWVDDDGVEEWDGKISPVTTRGVLKDVSVDLREFWEDESRPSLTYKSDEAWDSLLEIVKKHFGEEVSEAFSDHVTRREFDAEYARKSLQELLNEYEEIKEFPVPLEDMIYEALSSVDGWWGSIGWQAERPEDKLIEQFLEADEDNWYVSDASETVLNVGQDIVSGRANQRYTSFDYFAEFVQQRLDEQEGARIEEFDYGFTEDVEHLPRSVKALASEIESRNPQERLNRSAIETLLAGVPGYIQRDLVAKIGSEATVGELKDALTQLDPMSYYVERGEKDYKGETLSGAPFTFAFYPTDEIRQEIYYEGKRIGEDAGAEFAKRTFANSIGGHYGDAIGYVRIDGDVVWLASPIAKPGKAWVVENIQSDLMRNLYKRLNDKPFIDDSAGRHKLSKQQVRRILNALVNRFQDWTDMVVDHLEDAARSNGIDYLIWTNATIQKSRWSVADETAKRYYEDLPQREGFTKVEEPIDLFGEKFTGLWIKKM